MSVLIILLFFLFAGSAVAQDRPPQGIGFAQAEEGTWLCRHEGADEALSCARELCSEQAMGQDCVATHWCFPANWSGLMTIWLSDFHTTQVVCGAPSEKAVTDALAALCNGDELATSCDVTMIIDPDGNERSVEGVSFVGPAAALPVEAAPEPGHAGEAPASAEPAAEEPAAPQ